jgi:hypothetical protein
MLELTIGEVVLKVPETPQYLRLAMHLLEVRRYELEGDVSLTSKTLAAPEELPVELPVEDSVTTRPARLSSPTTLPQERRLRWFSMQYPRISLEDGDIVTPTSAEELKEFIRSRGLRPHPRGDASMLLWQVRDRLKLQVDSVPHP